ncbi:MAG: DUF1800 domain-containing protein, partial [Opitutaceae bacterium]|nr:DUF1800 domain-containing protein [Opitutaceae bacterium]
AVTLTITQPPVQLWSLSPTSVPPGTFTISLNGSNFHAGSVVRFGSVDLATTLLSPTRLRATGVAQPSQAGTTVPVIVVNTGLGGTQSSRVNLRITAPVSISVTVSPAAATVLTGGARTFTATVSGTSQSAVTWQVNGVAGGNATVGTVSASGVYTAPASLPSPATVTLQAASVAQPTSVGLAAITLQAAPTPTPSPLPSPTPTPPPAPSPTPTPAPSPTPTPTPSPSPSPSPTPTPPPVASTADLAAARLLEQATFGPTPDTLAGVKALGVEAWLDEQFALPESVIANPGGMGASAVQSQYLNRLSQAPDQLRQRVAYALSQIIVISLNKNIYPDEIVPYLRILSRNAFGNYRTLLEEISTSSQMGKYLDLANSNKPDAGSAANENYARELMQLFTIGLYQLNPDGTHRLDVNGHPIAAYDQFTVQQVALALTGWTYAGTGNNNWENFSGPLVAREVNHDMRPKVLVGVTLPGGQPTATDLTGVLNWLFQHPNVGPFLATRLIRALVLSNPSPAYIQRVSAVFDNNGSGVRGDLRAVVRAILLDPEARTDAPSSTSGRLKDPITHTLGLVRALGGSFSATNGQAWYLGRTGQTPLAPPSVFGFFSPLYRIPRSSLAGPEFQIYGPTEAVLRGNLFWQILSHPGADFPGVDLNPYLALAGDVNALIARVDQTLLYGRMPAGMRQALATAVQAQSDSRSRVLTALYLTSLSGLYAVQH